MCFIIHLLQLDDVPVPDVVPGGREERDGGEQQHDVLVGAPARLEALHEALVLLEQVHAQLRGLLQQLQAQLAGSVRRRDLEKEKKRLKQGSRFMSVCCFLSGD